jgi:hypothetical protein
VKASLILAALVLAIPACGDLAPDPSGGTGPPVPPVARDVATATSVDGAAAVELRLEPSVVQSGEAPKATLTNTGKLELVYGVPFKLELKTEDGWRWVNRKQAFILPLIPLRRGETSDPQPIAVYRDEPTRVDLEPGLYRVTKTAGLADSYPAGPTLRVQAEFRVS